MDRLIDERKPIFLDEFEKLPQNYLGIIRELTETTGVPFVLIGEEELLAYMRRDERVWSRTYQQIEFQPITESDIILYAGEAARIKLSSPVAKILLAASGGDFRIVRRDLLKLVFYATPYRRGTSPRRWRRWRSRSGCKGLKKTEGRR